MEKTIKLTTSEVIKWLTFLAIIISTFVVNQVDIRNLKKENNDRQKENKELLDKIQQQEVLVATVHEKINIIAGDVTTIKDAILSNSFVPHK